MAIKPKKIKQYTQRNASGMLTKEQDQFPTFDKVVDYQAGELLKGLIAGEFRDAVWRALQHAISWRDLHQVR